MLERTHIGIDWNVFHFSIAWQSEESLTFVQHAECAVFLATIYGKIFAAFTFIT